MFHSNFFIFFSHLESYLFVINHFKDIITQNKTNRENGTKILIGNIRKFSIKYFSIRFKIFTI